jgi:hypothetical protein
MLVAAGVLTTAQLEEALRAQVMWGGRLGTNLVHLEMIQLDELAKVLGRQRRMPTALEQHFERADSQLQRKLPAGLAEQLACIPLAPIAGGRIAIASIDVLEGRSLRMIGDQLGVAPEQLETAIAPELRIRYQLERVYGIARSVRFLRAPGKTSPPFSGADPSLDADTQLDVDIDVDLDDAAPDSGAIALPANRAEAKPQPVPERNDGFEARVGPPATHGLSGREALVRRPPQPVRASFDIDELELPTRPATNPPGAARMATTHVPLDPPAAARTSTSPPVARKPPEPSPFAFDLGELELPARASAPASPPLAAARTSTSPPVVQRTPEPAARDLDLGELELPTRTASPASPPLRQPPASRPGTDDIGPPARSTPSELAILVLEDEQAAAARPAAPAERRYVRTLADSVPPSPPPAQPVTKSPVSVAAKPVTDAAITATIRAIRGADDRERVAELAIEALSNRAGLVAGILLVIRGDAAIGWKGFNTLHTSLDELAVPMDRAGIVPHTIERGGTQRSLISKLGTIDRRLGQALRASETDELAVIPVRIVGQVMSFFALAITDGASLDAAESIATAAGISFTRLIRNANR